MTEARPEPLEIAWRNASNSEATAAVFLHELSGHHVWTVLRQPPGLGDAAPEYNLMQLKRNADGEVFVPIFTHPTHVTISIPSPAQLARVSMRNLLVAGRDQRYLVYPLSQSPFELHAARVAQLRAFIAARHQEPDAPCPTAPWAFQLPDDALYPVAVALAQWFVANGRVDEAYLYELTRGDASEASVILGLNEPADKALADRLWAVAAQAGANGSTFAVRFLPDEPSHRVGVERLGLEPFYRRPRST